MILVTGGAGFIGANFVLDWFDCSDEPVINLVRENLRPCTQVSVESLQCLGIQSFVRIYRPLKPPIAVA